MMTTTAMRNFVLLILSIATCWSKNQQHTSIFVESWSSPVFTTRYTRTNGNQITSTRYPRSYWSSSPFPGWSSSTSVFSVTPDESESNADDDDDDDEQFMQIESLSSNQVIELIEMSFFQSCFALSKGDLEPLKLFIVAVKTATNIYDGESASEIAQKVNAQMPSMRPLEPEEQELRDTWIRAIYLMLGHVVPDFVDNDNDDDVVAQTYRPILSDLVAIHQSGLGLNVHQFVSTRKDILLPKQKSNRNPLVLEDGPEDINDEDALQLAVVTQTVKVLFTTLVVLEDEREIDALVEEMEEEESSASSNKKSSGGGRGFG